MHPNPGVERGPIGLLPPDVLLNGCVRVVLFQRRAHRCDKVVKALLFHCCAHRLENKSAQPLSAVLGMDNDRKGRRAVHGSHLLRTFYAPSESSSPAVG